MHELYYIIILFFCFMSWVFSGFEIGIISLDHFKLEQEAKKNKQKKHILDFYEDSTKTFGTTVLGNNISNVIITSMATILFVEEYELNKMWVTLTIAFTILIFCEIFPKNLFHDYPNRCVDLFFPLIRACYIILLPFTKIITLINIKLKKLFHIDDSNQFAAFSKDDFAFILTQTYHAGEIQKPQKEMLEEALDFNELNAKNVMIPRLEVVAIPDDMPYKEILKFAGAEGYTRYPVYHENLDEITGVLIIYDLLKYHGSPKANNNTLLAKDIQRQMFFVPESMEVNTLLKEMQTHKKSIAAVVDSYGGTSGIVTIEDILEEIVGEIEDEYDVEDNEDFYKIDANNWMVKGFVKVDDLNEELGIKLPEGEYETVAGLLIDSVAKIPTRGQKITIGDYKFEIVEVTHKKIVRVKISV